MTEANFNLPQLFWDSFRQRWRARLATWIDGSGTPAWTRMIIAAAKESCSDFGITQNRKLHVESERINRLDVHAVDAETDELIIAFESELACWGYNGKSGKDWRQEFPKLCAMNAKLRVLASTFESGTGQTFPMFLDEKLRSMQSSFINGAKGPFCLIFGPESPKKDPEQPWLAYSLEEDFSLRPLNSAQPLRPRRVINGIESPLESPNS